MQLTLPVVTNSFNVGIVEHYDASLVVLGCVLRPHDKVIAYASRQHKVHEKKHLSHNLEVAAVVFSLKI